MENQGLSRVSRHIENGTATAVPLFLCLAPPCRQHEQHADDAKDQAHPQHGVGAAPVDGVPRQEVAETVEDISFRPDSGSTKSGADTRVRLSCFASSL